MLTVKTGRLGSPARVEKATQIVVEDKFGNPIAVIVETLDGTTTISTVDQGEDEHYRYCRSIGIDRVMYVEKMGTQPVPENGRLIRTLEEAHEFIKD